MPDLHPTLGNISSLKTSPPVETTAIYRKQPAYSGQLGLATSYSPTDNGFTYTTKPNYYQLSVWDEARRKEPIIKQGLEYIQQAVLAKIGSYSHADAQIDDFVQANIENKIKPWISDLLISSIWAGFAVSEILFCRKIGPNGMPQIWIDDLINYHPLQIHFYLNDYGVVKDGDVTTNSQIKSGIWVPAPSLTSSSTRKGREMMGSFVRLPKYKRVYLTLGGEGNNPYGRSLLDSVIPYHFFKEAYRDMMTVALDRYGTPLIYAIVPPLDTNQLIENPDGTTRPQTLHELTVEEMKKLSSESALVFTQISKDQPVKLEALTTGNNFSDAFTQAIDLCDHNMMLGLGIPNLLMKDTSSRLGSSGAGETQLQIFDSLITSIFDLVVTPFLYQVCTQLIQYNFDPRVNNKAYHPGTIQKKPTRTAELKTIVLAIESLTGLGYLNPYNKTDFRYVRELVGLPDREITSDDRILPYRKLERTDIKKVDPALPSEVI